MIQTWSFSRIMANKLVSFAKKNFSMIHHLSPLLPLISGAYILNIHLLNSSTPINTTLPRLFSGEVSWKTIFHEMDSYSLLVLPALWLLYRALRPFLRSLSRVDGKAVVVTGSDTGFGRAIALKLASEGVYVFAGVLTAASGKKLVADSGGNKCLIPVVMNVCSDKDVQNCLAKVKKSKHQLVGLVNNAGISAFGFSELLPMRLVES